LEGGEKSPIFDERRIPFQRKAFPADVETRTVKREDDQEKNREVQKRKDQCGPEAKDPALNPCAPVPPWDSRPPRRSRRGRHRHTFNLIEFSSSRPEFAPSGTAATRLSRITQRRFECSRGFLLSVASLPAIVGAC
jgi:hypothetical protein